MAAKTYTLEHDDGRDWAAVMAGNPVIAVGDTFEADLPAPIETAVVAAGWVTTETATKKKGG